MGTGPAGARGRTLISRKMSRFGTISFVLFAILCVVTVRAQDLDALGEMVRNGTTEEKRTALFDLRNIRTPEASRLAVPALSDPDELVRSTAAGSVVFLPPDEVVAVLLPNLKDKEDFVRRETAYALGNVRDRTAVRPLVEVASKDKSFEVRNAAVFALGEIGDPSAVDFLVALLSGKPKDSRAFERSSAAKSIGRIAQAIQNSSRSPVTPESFLPSKYKAAGAAAFRDLATEFPQFKRALAVLEKALSNSKEAADTRREAAFAIGAIDGGSRETLKKCSVSPDYYLAEICKEGLLKAESR